MKAGGIRVVSTYVFWIHHEEIEGRFDWAGRRDLRHFVELAGRSGLMVWVRIGPWDHGEVRNGGLPDWLLQKCATRENDPAYLQYVARFYGEIGRQLKGLFWQDGGPIIGVQIENEYSARGPGKGEKHILTLKRIAEDAGLRAPFYSVTGWDNAAVPGTEVIPVFGGYPDGFWYRQPGPLPPSPNYFFTPIRCEENVGPDLCSLRPDIDARYASYPFLTAEMGGGMELAYHRRPLMTADDIAALEVVKLGSGVSLYGYYMFHGGTNPDGKLTTLEESQATGYPNDLPVKTYDFQAPLGEFGQMHSSFRDLKTLHLFLSDFGAALAPMTAYFPEEKPAGKMDSETARLAVRSDSRSGFVFINNYQKDHPLPERKQFQAQLRLAGGVITVPQQPVGHPGGRVHLLAREPGGGRSDARVRHRAAPFETRRSRYAGVLRVAGNRPEFAFLAGDGVSIDASIAVVRRENGRVFVTAPTPGPGVAIEVRGKDGQRTRIVLLSREQARNLWKAPLAGRDRLILSRADLYFEADRIHLGSADPASLGFSVFPALGRDVPHFRRTGSDGIFESYSTTVEPVRAEPMVRELRAAGRAAPVRMGKEVAMAPVDSDFSAAARWSIRVPEIASDDVGEVFLRIAYQGDVARLYAGKRLITDDFYHGAPWEIGLRNISAAEWKQGLELEILPLGHDAPVYLAPAARPADPENGQTARLTEVKVVPFYRALADLGR